MQDTGLLLVVGVVVSLANSTYEFVRQDMPLIVAILAFSAASGLLFLMIRLIRRARSERGSVNTNLSVASPAHPDPASLRAAKWVRPGEAVDIQDTKISTGMFYCGRTLPLADGRAIPQYAINPKLPASAGQGDVAGASMPYWPSYASMTPQARRAFLNWMAGGRKDPSCGIGHVFIFFYGLEHRLFVEGNSEDARIFATEVRRLFSIYGSSNSFRGYAEKFLSGAALLAGAARAPPSLAPDVGGEGEIPLAVRLHLGAKLAASDRLGAGDALLWLLHLPQFRLRTAAVRCFEDFRRVWFARFTDAFGAGYKIAVPAAKTVIRYRAASGAFEVDIPGAHSQYPDIAAVTQSFDDLKALAESCTAGLDAFSRFIGKNPDRRTSLQAALLLPETLRKDAVKTAAHGLMTRISELMDGRRTATTELRDLLQAASLEVPADGQPPSATAEQLGQTLDLLDIAMEPDRRYGSGFPRVNDPVVVFTADSGAPIDPAKPAYRAMKVRVEVAALAAASDGDASSDELQSIVGTIRADAELTRDERLRLIGYAVTIFKSPPKQERILRRLSDTREAERKAIAAAATAVIGSQENADPKSVRFLEKLHKTLKLPAGQVYSDLHRAAPADAPVPVSVERRVAGIRIPKEVTVEPPAASAANGIRIDKRRLADVQRDTAAVSEILSEIFIEPQPAEPAKTANATMSAFTGLDSEHAQLLIYLQSSGGVGRTEFEEKARALKLLPAGAIERINDWSFDHFDEPLLEDGESISLIPHLREKLAELKAMTA